MYFLFSIPPLLLYLSESEMPGVNYILISEMKKYKIICLRINKNAWFLLKVHLEVGAAPHLLSGAPPSQPGLAAVWPLVVSY